MITLFAMRKRIRILIIIGSIAAILLIYEQLSQKSFIQYMDTKSAADLIDNNSYILNECSSDLLKSKSLPIEEKITKLIKQCYIISPSGIPYDFKLAKLAGEEMGKFLRQLAKSNPPGFFIEAGAKNGVAASTTLWLEQNYKWKGLLIEPNKMNCKSYKNNTRNAWYSCTCISPSNKAEVVELEIPYTEKTGVANSLQLANARLSDSIFTSYNNVINKTSVYQYEKVQCFPLASYLIAINVNTVDLISLDTQGFEDKMLSAFPFDKIKVRYMMVEHFNPKTPRIPKTYDEDFVKLVTGLGFTFIKHYDWDYYFRNNNEKDLPPIEDTGEEQVIKPVDGVERDDGNTFVNNECSEPLISSNDLSTNELITQLIKKCYIYPPSGIPYNKTMAKKPGYEMGVFLDQMAQITSRGFFIEAGAKNGVGASTTAWLEQNYKWTGLLIEPNKINCESFPETKRDSWYSCTCISPSEKAEKLVLEIPVGKETGVPNSLQLANARFPNSVFHSHPGVISKTSKFIYDTVQCFPLASYLNAINVTTVDLISLDTQGFEDKMLSAFPFDKIKVRYMMVEHFNLKTPHIPKTYDEDFVKLITGFGFTFIKHFDWDYYFRNNDEKDLPQVQQPEVIDDNTFVKNNCSEPLLASSPSGKDLITKLIKQCYLVPPSGTPFNKIVTTLPDEDIGPFVEELSKLIPSGFYIEAGAMNGVTYSNTVWLEQNFEWTGLLIEANKINCPEVLNSKRNSWFSCSCISPSGKAEEIELEIPVTKDTGVPSTLQLANARLMSSVFRSYNDIINKTSVYKYDKVQCFPLASYLDALNVTKVDLMSLDTQGFEDKMLSTFPFDRINVRYIIIEHFNPSTPDQPKSYDDMFVKLITGFGFTLIKHHDWNYFFINNKEKITNSAGAEEKNTFVKNNCSEPIITSNALSSKDLIHQLINKCYLMAPSGIPYNVSKRGLPGQEIGVFVESLSKIITNGFFIEAGAKNGVTASNTVWLEQKCNWTGLLIEPNSVNCNNFLATKRNAWFSCTCISPSSKAEEVKLEIPVAKDTGVPNSLQLANARLSNSIFRTFNDVIKQTSDYRYEKVQCFPLASYLEVLNVTKVDLISLDTQGFEDKMLNVFPFNTIHVGYMVIEHFNQGTPTRPNTHDEKFVELISDFGFNFIKQSGMDYFFKNNKEM